MAFIIFTYFICTVLYLPEFPSITERLGAAAGKPHG